MRNTPSLKKDYKEIMSFLLLFVLTVTIQNFAGVHGKQPLIKRNIYAAKNETFRPEHIMFNVQEPVKMVRWYCNNLGMKVIRKGTAPTYSTFVADSGEHMMFELGNFSDYPKMDFPKADINTMHIAFFVHHIKQIKKKLLSAGATVAQDLFTTPGGDKVMVLRDPWGLPIQFVERKVPMIKYTGVRLEHLEFNVPDTHKKADWYVKNLGMKIMRKGGAPDYNMFISDPDHNMMMELNQKKGYPMFDFWKISHMSFHFAFEVKDIQSVKKKLIAAGAQLVDDVAKTSGGDLVMMMRDPWGEPIQFVHRLHPMLN